MCEHDGSREELVPSAKPYPNEAKRSVTHSLSKMRAQGVKYNRHLNINTFRGNPKNVLQFLRAKKNI